MATEALRRSFAAVVLVALTGLAGCSNDTSGSGSSGSDAGSTASSGSEVGGPALAGSPGGGAKDAAVAARPGVSRGQVRTSAVVRTGQIAVTGKDLTTLRGRVGDLLERVGGSIDDERTTNDRHGRVHRSTLVLRIPVAKFDTVKRTLEGLGTLTSSTESANDVTTEVIDVAERVQTLQNSLDRLQRFQRAARDVRDLIRFEDDITRRQSELQSLKAQQAYLTDQTSMSTITLRLSTPATHVETPGALDDAGFLPGLRGGWHALVGMALVVLTVLGALVPFLVAGTVLGMPTWLAVRALLRRRRGSSAPVVE